MTRLWSFIFLDQLLTVVPLMVVFLGCLVNDLLSMMILLQICFTYDVSAELVIFLFTIAVSTTISSNCFVEL